MKKILFIAIGLWSFCAQAQDLDPFKKNPTTPGGYNPDPEPLVYKVVRDKPEHLRFATILLPLWHLAGSKINSSLYDANFGAFYHEGNIQAMVRYKYGLGDKIAPDSYEFGSYPNHPLIFSIYEPGKAQELNAVGTYFFNSRKTTENIFMTVRSSKGFRRSTTVPATMLHKVGVNLGYAQGFTWYNMNNTDLNVELHDSENDIRQYNLMSMSSVQNYKFIKAGLTFTKGYDITYDFEGYGKYTDADMKTTWVNLIVAVQNDFDDVYAPVAYTTQDNYYNSYDQNIYVADGSINHLNKKLPIGIEVGHRYLTRSSGFGYEAAVKYLPGMMNNINFMVEVGVSYGFNFFGKDAQIKL